MHSSLCCARCGLEHSAEVLQNLCRNCAKPLLAGYDLDAIRERFTPEVVRRRALRSMWKFHEVLPVARPEDAVTLGEGLTPLLHCRRQGPMASFERLFVKDESFNPTGSFKARGMAAAVTRAKALGVKVAALPSAGNAAGALAHYAALAGMECYLFMPEDTPPANIAESVLAGAKVALVNGLISDCGRLVREGCERFGWFDLSTLKEPFRIEGKKIMGYELAFDLQDAFGTKSLLLPDVVIYPTGGGTGLIGMWKAFDEMEKLGWIGPERPRMVVVQAAGCAPIVRAYELDAEFAEPFPNAATVAAGLRVPAAVGDFLMLAAVRESGGIALTVRDDELLAGVRELTSFQGIQASPEGAAAWKAVEKLRESGWLDATEKIVLFNTGSGLKYNHLFPPDGLTVLDKHDPDCLTRFADAARPE